MKKFLSLKRTVATLTPLLLSFPLIAINTNLSYATSLTVSARISEATCAIQVNSGSTGVADLGEWVYSKSGSVYQTMPVDSGTAYSAASSTVSIDPNCPTIGMATIAMKFPASSATEGENLKSARRYSSTSNTGPTFVITSQDGRNAFPIWADIVGSSTAFSTSYNRCSVQPNGLEYLNHSATNKAIFTGSDGHTYGSSSTLNMYNKNGAFTELPAGGQTVGATVNSAGGTATSSIVPLVSGQTIICMFGPSNNSGNFPDFNNNARIYRANLTTFKLRFTGPREIPSNGWADPAPAPGTEFNGTIILSMSYN